MLVLAANVAVNSVTQRVAHGDCTVSGGRKGGKKREEKGQVQGEEKGQVQLLIISVGFFGWWDVLYSSRHTRRNGLPRRFPPERPRATEKEIISTRPRFPPSPFPFPPFPFPAPDGLASTSSCL